MDGRAANGTGIRGRVLGIAMAAVTVLCLVGCNGFFVSENTGTTTSSSGNAVYVANATTLTVSGYAIGTGTSGTLTAVSGSPYALTVAPVAIVVTPASTAGAASEFVYVGGGGQIFMYTVGTNGALTAGNNGVAVAQANVQSMDISPDGKWLFVLDQSGLALDEFAINPANGLLATQTGALFQVANTTPRMVRVAPNGQYVFVALGTGGDLVFSFNTGTGLVAPVQTLPTGSATLSDNAIAVDANSAYLYVARSGPGGGLEVFTIGTAGALNAIAGSPFAVGTQPISIVLDGTGKYVYVGNRADSTISEYSIGTGNVLTAVTGSPTAAGTNVTALALDSTKKYVLAAANGGSPDLAMYGFDSIVGGKLDALVSTSTGTDPTGPVAIAVTH